MSAYLQIDPLDNVAVALRPLSVGEPIRIGLASFELLESIPAGHKFALQTLSEGAFVVKYGHPIGRASEAILPGAWVHSHNLKTALEEEMSYRYEPDCMPLVDSPSPIYVEAYVRSADEVAIRNELWIVPTVGCINGQATAIAEEVRRRLDCSHLDDVRAYTHPYGCSQLGTDHENTRKALAAMIRHPHAGGVLVLGLGCENNQIAQLKPLLEGMDESRVRFLEAQSVGDELEEGVRLCEELLERTRSDKREPIALSRLKIGLKCGGSDGFSGITANPLLGEFSDYFIAMGGTILLTEVPEMFGAETLLMKRCPTSDLFKTFVAMIESFKRYYRSQDLPIYENPSPGNKAGGITTLEEKSLGCIRKGGHASVCDVLAYAQRASQRGLNLLNAPGNDLVASSALALSGCNLLFFTTGRGTPLGTFVPTVKISTQSALAELKRGWIDFNAGTLLEGESMEALLQLLIRKLKEIASGEKTLHEQAQCKDFTIFKSGVTL